MNQYKIFIYCPPAGDGEVDMETPKELGSSELVNLLVGGWIIVSATSSGNSIVFILEKQG
jgi:hypothetical protein